MRQPRDALLALLLQAGGGGDQRHGLIAQSAQLPVLGITRLLQLLHLMLQPGHLEGGEGGEGGRGYKRIRCCSPVTWGGGEEGGR